MKLDFVDSLVDGRLLQQLKMLKQDFERPLVMVEGIEDIRRVSSKYRAEFEEMEEKFQTMQDWPGIDPIPMEPVKVLEEDFDEEEVLLETSESMKFYIVLSL